MTAPANQPLVGIRVLDLSRVLAGPFCSMVLADLGASVIKVERPGVGDDTRAWGPPFRDGISAYFASVNRNNRSLTLDMRQPAGCRILEQLVKRSDVLLENFLPGSAAKLGLIPERLRELNPRLVACSISGFGRTGPWADERGYDIMIQAMSGLMAITGKPDGEPMKVGVAVSDVLTGLYAAASVLAALVRRERHHDSSANDSLPQIAQQPTGDDDSFCHIDIALLDCTLASLVNVIQAYLLTGQRPGRYGNAHPHIVPYQCFQTADGFMILGVGNKHQWRRFCRAAGRPDLEQDVRFGTNSSRVTNRKELVAILTEEFRGRSTAEWTQLLAKAQIPHAPVLRLDELFSHPQIQARNMVVETQGGLRLVGRPIKINAEEPPDPLPPPELGQHSDQILRELGYTDQQIGQLRAEGVV